MTSGRHPTPPARQRQLVGMVADLGPTFAERAAGYDRDARFPHENYADLRAAGLLGLCVPAEYGGLGADFATYGLVSEELGRHCGSTALTFNMHTATMLLCGQIADDLEMSPADRAEHERRRAAMYAGVISAGHIHAQPFSEGNAPGATAGVATLAVPADGGWRLTGRKIFASLSGAADRHNVICVAPDDPTIRFMSVPTGSEGLSFTGDWDPLGMRGTVSLTLLLEDVFVPADAELLPAGVFDQVASRWPHFYLTLSFTYLGIMRAVMDFTDGYLAGRIGPGSRRDNPQKQAGWAEMQVSYERAHALARHVLAEAGVDPTPAQVRRAWASMVSTMETAPELASLAVRVCGGRSLLRPHTLERLYRDARCGATMLPWSVEACLDRLGRAGLLDDTDTGAPHA
ncbi:MAG: acyl-CoA/acyl-ACP dehydrogenase [bacterium]|nr:acyl-CoA/acyl-ACP dehydrogenase [bacterium]MXV90688.1 acyl-CoA dehydrogenase [Acidimicrobiia bacterium]MYC45133.1 acyl-CoA dehydrogenase [Acidimicrobiia bacterium]MYI21028.1 acyl-CoA dehydrogenase [Acidimicrobiia bacterium]